MYNYNNGDAWLNRPSEGYHWEQRNYERYLKDGTGCEYAVAGMAGVGMTGMSCAYVMGDGVGTGCDGGGGAACGAGGCGGCGAC